MIFLQEFLFLINSYNNLFKNVTFFKNITQSFLDRLIWKIMSTGMQGL